MRPERRGSEGSRSLSRPLGKRQSLGICCCENQQYVQTEWMSPTLHVPRHFPSHKSVSHKHMLARRRSAHNSCASAAPCLPLADPYSAMDAAQALCSLRLTVTFPLAAADGATHARCGNCWKSQGAKWGIHGDFKPAVWSFVTARHYGDKRFTITMNTSLRDVPCPVACRMRALHTYSHKSFTLCSHNVPTWTRSSTQEQPRSISSLYILKYRMKTEIKLNKTQGAEAGLV